MEDVMVILRQLQWTWALHHSLQNWAQNWRQVLISINQRCIRGTCLKGKRISDPVSSLPWYLALWIVRSVSNSCPLLVCAGEKRGLKWLCGTWVLPHSKYTRKALSYITHSKREHSGKEMKGCRAQLCKRKIIRACLSPAQTCRGEKQGMGRLVQRELGVVRAGGKNLTWEWIKLLQKTHITGINPSSLPVPALIEDDLCLAGFFFQGLRTCFQKV